MNSELPTFRTTNSLKQETSTIGLMHSDRSEIISHRGLVSNNSFDPRFQKSRFEPGSHMKPIDLTSSAGISPKYSEKSEEKKKTLLINIPNINIDSKMQRLTQMDHILDSHRRLVGSHWEIEKEDCNFSNKSYQINRNDYLDSSPINKEGFLTELRNLSAINFPRMKFQERMEGKDEDSLNVSLDIQPRFEEITFPTTIVTQKNESPTTKKAANRLSIMSEDYRTTASLLNTEETDIPGDKNGGSLGNAVGTLSQVPNDGFKLKLRLEKVDENESENEQGIENKDGQLRRETNTVQTPRIQLTEQAPHINLQSQELSFNNSNEGDVNVNIGSPISDERTSSVIFLPEIEAQLFLKRSVPFFLALALVSVFMLLITKGTLAFCRLFVIFYCYLAYYTLEKFARTCCSQRESWRIREDIFCMMDGISGIFLLGCIDQKLTDKLSFASIGFFPFIITALVHLVISTAPRKVKHKQTLVRLFYIAQSFFITAKIDGIFDWSWGYVCLFIWLFCGIICLYFLAFAIILVLLLIFAAFKQRLNSELNLSTEFLGYLWYSLYYGLCVIAGIALIGINYGYERTIPDFRILNLASIFNLVVNIVLILLTLFAFKHLTKLVQIFQSTNNSTSTVSQAPVITVALQTNKIEFQVEKKENYFLMLSSTYFMPLDNGFFQKNEESLKRVKALLTNMKLWSFNKEGKNAKEGEAKSEIFDIEALQKFKENLDKKFSSFSSKQTCVYETKLNERNYKTPKEQQKCYKGVTPTHNLRSSENPKKEFKRHLSAEDRFDMKTLQTEISNKGAIEEENLCYLCFERVPDAVLMNCGHAGICYECAISIIKKKNECMECRKPVDVIYRIDPNPKLPDIVKGIEQSRVKVVTLS